MSALGIVSQFAAAEPAKGDIIAGLGINGTLLIFQLIAFLLLFLILAKFIFPVFMRIVDKREKLIEESTRAAIDAEKNAAAAEDRIKKMLSKARSEAGDIVTTAKDEANALIAEAEKKASNNAESILARARESIEKEVASAKRDLHNETVELVALATKKVVGATVDEKVDTRLIETAVREAK